MQTIILAIALAALTSASCDRVETVPAKFVGDWAGSPDSCGSDADDLLLRLAPDHISYWESNGPIRSVVVRGNEIALVSELSGEGETWLSTATFKLSSDGRTLTDSVSTPGKDVVRFRCDSHHAARGLTMRSSRTRFAPQTAWQVQLATLFAPLHESA